MEFEPCFLEPFNRTEGRLQGYHHSTSFLNKGLNPEVIATGRRAEDFPGTTVVVIYDRLKPPKLASTAG